jgi:prophage antirepressor-like protein
VTDERYAFKTKLLNTNPRKSGQRKTHDMWMLTEAGLYRFLLTSRSKLAKVFADWVCFDVIPAIRKTGQYEVSAQDKAKLSAANDALRAKLQETKQQHKQAKAELDAEVVKMKQQIARDKAELTDAEVLITKLSAKVDALKKASSSSKSDQDKLRQSKQQLAGANQSLAILKARLKQEYASLADAREDLQVVQAYLSQFNGATSVVATLSRAYARDRKIASSPMVSQKELFMLRVPALSILHTCAYVIVKGHQEVLGCKIDDTKAKEAVVEIMGIKDIDVPARASANCISMYTLLAGIARTRLNAQLQEDGQQDELPANEDKKKGAVLD